MTRRAASIPGRMIAALRGGIANEIPRGSLLILFDVTPLSTLCEEIDPIRKIWPIAQTPPLEGPLWGQVATLEDDDPHRRLGGLLNIVGVALTADRPQSEKLVVFGPAERRGADGTIP